MDMRQTCSLCFSILSLEDAITFEHMPTRAQQLDLVGSKNLDDQTTFNLISCKDCGLLQLDCGPVPYYREVVRSAGISPEMVAFRSDQFRNFVEGFGLQDAPVVEFGSGAGEYLAILSLSAIHAVGTEFGLSSQPAWARQGLSVYHYYPGESPGQIPGAPFSGFIVLNFLEHAPNIREFLQGIRNNLRPGAVGLIEVPNTDMILRDKLATEIMTDHLYYFTEETLRLALQVNGFDVLDCRPVWHEYSLSATVRLRESPPLQSLTEDITLVRNQLEAFLSLYPPKSVVVWGAGHQSFASLAVYGLREKVAYIVDSAPFKQGRLSPATHVEIRSPESLYGDPRICAIIVMAGSYANEVIANLRASPSGSLGIAVLRHNSLEVVNRGSPP